eukprot:29257-Chlamydomonas_euryale.AAC.1
MGTGRGNTGGSKRAQHFPTDSSVACCAPHTPHSHPTPHAPHTRTLRCSVAAIERPMLVLPTPGGPTRHRIFPWALPRSLPTAMNSRMRSLTSSRPKWSASSTSCGAGRCVYLWKRGGRVRCACACARVRMCACAYGGVLLIQVQAWLMVLLAMPVIGGRRYGSCCVRKSQCLHTGALCNDYDLRQKIGNCCIQKSRRISSSNRNRKTVQKQKQKKQFRNRNRKQKQFQCARGRSRARHRGLHTNNGSEGIRRKTPPPALPGRAPETTIAHLRVHNVKDLVAVASPRQRGEPVQVGARDVELRRCGLQAAQLGHLFVHHAQRVGRRGVLLSVPTGGKVGGGRWEVLGDGDGKGEW